ncbi:MAG: glycoside hydrolase family 71/99-like protein [Paludibacteraceae bacterium]|nr:glycoside hydrolase family 71/99-like protein [Paludibacteraceae bacterium]
MKHFMTLLAVVLSVQCAWAATFKGSVVLSNPQQQNNVEHFMKNDPNDEPYTYYDTQNGKSCVCIPNGKFGYFKVNQSVIPSSMNNLIFKVTYLDNNDGWMSLEYNGTGGGNPNYCNAGIQKHGTGEWMTVTIAVTNAYLHRAQNQSADFRINGGNYIAQVELYEGVMDPVQEPKAQHNKGTEFIGSSVAGYQCWFKVGGKNDFWHHWGNDVIEQDGTRWPRAYNHTFEIYPDVRDYPATALTQTGFADLGNGAKSQLYRSEDTDVINQHFADMKKAGLGGVAVQRFLGNEMRSVVKTDQSHLKKIQRAAENNGRLFYICYDITSNGLENTWADLIRFDWVYNIEQTNELTQSPAYATVNGKPVVEIWGIGFDDRPGTAQQTQELITFLKNRGCYVIGGVPTYWREGRNDSKGSGNTSGKAGSKESYYDVYLSCDMLSPWYVGRFGNHNDYQYFIGLMKGDIQLCNERSVAFMPVLFSGFGWATWNPGQINQAPRLAGRFLWEQVREVKNAGCQNMYFAMFDEYDEGTAIYKAAEDWTMLPTDAYFLTMSADGVWCSSDFYLRLAGAATDVLKGQRTLTDEVPIPYSLGPVYYRNSFEQKTTKYNMIDGQYKSEGTFPVDPCLYNAKNITGTAAYALSKDAHHSGAYALQLAGSVNGTYRMQFSETKIVITGAQALTAYLKANSGDYRLNIACLVNGTWYDAPAVQGTDWQENKLLLPSSLSGQTIQAIGVRVEGNGNCTVYADDVLLQDTSEQPSGWHRLNSGTDMPTKVLHNNQILINKNGIYYDLVGTRH